MKKIFILITILIALAVNAQYVRKSDGNKIHPSLLNAYNGSNKMWILFTDKGIFDSKDANQFFSTNKDLVTEKSIWRRELRSNTLLDINDVPLNNDYIKVLEKMGIEIENSSKWLNGVSAKLTYEQMLELNALDFVYKIYPLAVSKQKPDLLSVDKEIEKRVDQDTITNKYNYGSISAVQIEQIYVNMLHNKSYTGKDVIVAIFDTGFKVIAENTENGLVYKATHKALDHLNIIFTYSLIDDTNYVGMMEMTEDELTNVDHGTKMLALMGAYYPGDLISPAFGADYMLFETENPLEEVTSEEDNWIRAAEMADSLGVDIISSSVGYKDWYPYTYMTGDSCLITKAANIAVSKGIIVVNSIGNVTEGISKGDTSIIAPADGDLVMAVGGVDDYYLFSAISATGPPYDKYLLLSDTLLDPDTLGYDLDTFRIKPDILALAEFPYTVIVNDDSSYNFVSGTSGATALIAGGCALLLQAHPDWTPMMVKESLIKTAYSPYKSYGDSSYWALPNDTVGNGIADFYSALMYADTHEVIDISQDELFPPYPNPYSVSSGNVYFPFKLINVVKNLSLEIYTIDGKIIYSDEKKDILPGVYSDNDGFTWDGRNSDGIVVCPGIYVIMLNSHFEKDFKKISIIP